MTNWENLTAEERALEMKKFVEKVKQMQADLDDFQYSASDHIDSTFIENIDKAFDALGSVLVFAEYYVSDN